MKHPTLYLDISVYFIILPSWPTNNKNNNLFITHFTKQMLNGVNTKETQQTKQQTIKTTKLITYRNKKDKVMKYPTLYGASIASLVNKFSKTPAISVAQYF